jgi:hypothetical protein
MASARVLEASGKKVILIDLSRAELDEMVRVLREARGMIRSEPPGSVLTLTDLSGAHSTPAITRQMKEFVRDNGPFVKAGAVVGLSALMRPIYDAVMLFSNRSIPAFTTREEALQWLLSR